VCAVVESSWSAYRGLRMEAVQYRYELRRGDEVVATGRLSREQPFEVGGWVEVAGRTGIVRTIEPILGERELRLVVQLRRESGGR
jgi:hypothetical protein